MRIWVTSQAAFNDGRGSRRWKLGSAIQPHHSARDTRTGASTPSAPSAFETCYFPLWVSPPGQFPSQKSFCRVGGKRGAGISSNLPDKDFPLRWYYEDSPFLTAPPRTVLAAFTAHGSPVSSGLPVRKRRISRHCLVYPLYSLPPLAMYQAFPGSDYYGGSVAMGLSTFRRSRIPTDETFSALRACLSSNPLIGGHPPQRALRNREQ
jgi:hypothetical protein